LYRCCASRQLIAAKARHYTVEAHAAVPFAAKTDPTTEGLPDHLGRQSLASNFAVLEAAGAPLVAAGNIFEATGKGAVPI